VSQSNLPPDILALPVAERIELAAKIWDSIENDEVIDAEHRGILEKRLAEYRANPSTGIEFDELKSKLRGAK
jgi:putative addiction module component (TIGR02574 family)